MPDNTRRQSVRSLRGGCMCGLIEYEAADRFLYALNCHCSKCRRTTGSVFKPIAGLQIDDFRVVRGEDNLFAHGDPDGIHDLHCRTCGSLIYSWIAENGSVKIHIPMGTLIDAPTARPSMHIFVGSKAPWYEINDGLPQYQEFP